MPGDLVKAERRLVLAAMQQDYRRNCQTATQHTNCLAR